MKYYSVSVRFDMPNGGTVNVVAETADQAKQKVLAQLNNYRNPEIIDVVELPSMDQLVEDANNSIN